MNISSPSKTFLTAFAFLILQGFTALARPTEILGPQQDQLTFEKGGVEAVLKPDLDAKCVDNQGHPVDRDLVVQIFKPDAPTSTMKSDVYDLQFEVQQGICRDGRFLANIITSLGTQARSEDLEYFPRSSANAFYDKALEMDVWLVQIHFNKKAIFPGSESERTFDLQFLMSADLSNSDGRRQGPAYNGSEIKSGWKLKFTKNPSDSDITMEFIPQ